MVLDEGRPVLDLKRRKGVRLLFLQPLGRQQFHLHTLYCSVLTSVWLTVRRLRLAGGLNWHWHCHQTVH